MSLDTSRTEPSASTKSTVGLFWWDWGRVGLGRKEVMLDKDAQGIVPGVELREPGGLCSQDGRQRWCCQCPGSFCFGRRRGAKQKSFEAPAALSRS